MQETAYGALQGTTSADAALSDLQGKLQRLTQ